ncbi:UNVERIFIED_CONTAM: hypothetical protein NCL1_44816 [Trichonephila clavipes]
MNKNLGVTYKYVFLGIKFAGMVLLQGVNVAVATNYCVQCETLILYIKGICLKLHEKSLEIRSAMHRNSWIDRRNATGSRNFRSKGIYQSIKWKCSKNDGIMHCELYRAYDFRSKPQCSMLVELGCKKLNLTEEKLQERIAKNEKSAYVIDCDDIDFSTNS